MNKEERINVLNNTGIDTSKYFNIKLPDGLKEGSTITVMINENGQPEFVDEIAEQIIEDGYVRNTKLHRRFVMAQMFRMLNYVSYNGNKNGYTEYLNTRYAYQYQFEMMLREIKVLGELEMKDEDSFIERSHFFNINTVSQILMEYLKELKTYVDSLPNKNCKGIPYKTINGKDIFVEDLDKKLYYPISNEIHRISMARNYKYLYVLISRFVKTMVKLPSMTKKSKTWIDTYKGEGAFYTLKNLIMYHECKIYDSYKPYSTYDSMIYINSMLDKYNGEGWRMFALMKKVIEDNNFDFDKRMSEIYK